MVQKEAVQWNLGMRPGYEVWVRGLDTRPGYEAWVRGLGTRPGYEAWVRGLGMRPGYKAWVRGLVRTDFRLLTLATILPEVSYTSPCHN